MIKKIIICIILSILLSTKSFAIQQNVIEGNKGAPIEIKVYYSASCPACGKFFSEDLIKIKKEYVSTEKAKIEYVPYPLDYISLGVEVYLNCIPEEKQHKKALTQFMTQQSKWLLPSYKPEVSKKIIDKYLTQLEQEKCEQDTEAFENLYKRVDSYKEKKIVRKGTPAVFVNGKPAKNYSYEEIKKLID